MKKIVIIYNHPYDGSFSRAIIDNAIKGLEISKKPYEVIDLHKDGFDPIKSDSKLISKYKKYISDSDSILIATPVWWSGPPAILQGFLEQVLSKENEITNLKSAYMYTTSATPNIVSKILLRSPILNGFVNGVFKPMGIKNIRYRNLDCIANSPERRERFLNKISKDMEVINGK